MSAFDDQIAKMKKAPLRRGGGNWIDGEGLYEVEILSTLRKMGWNKSFTARDKELFIVEFRFISSTNPKHAPGSTASWTCKDPSEGGSGDVKAFVLAAVGIDPRPVKDTDEELQLKATLLAFAAMGEAEAFKRLELPEDVFIGLQLRLETKMVTTKNNTPFTKHIWSPADAPASDAAA
jgi:hypothetical protein